MIAVEVIGRDALSLPILDDTVVVEENREVILRAPPESRAFHQGVELPYHEDAGGFPIRPRFEVGTLDLQIEHADGTRTLRMEVQPSRRKLSPSAWATMLDDIEAWLPQVLVGAEATSHGMVGLSGASSPLLVQALIPLIPELAAAVGAVVQSPRIVRRRRSTHMPIHKVRRARRRTTRWLGRHPEVAGWAVGEAGSGPPPEVPLVRLKDTVDHAANRHIAWMVRRVAKVLLDVAAVLDPLSRDDGALTQRPWWCRERAAALRAGASGLERLLQRTFLGDLKPEPANEAALLVVVDHPLYRRVHTLGRRFLAARFTLEAGDTGAPVRPSFDLYELWTVLAVRRMLDTHLGNSIQWQRPRGFEKILRLGTGHAWWRGRSERGELTLHFNLTFPSMLVGTGRLGQASISTQRRPDLCITWSGRSTRWLALDAKYRAGRAHLGAAMESAHLYRDALRWPDFGGPARGALLLAPAKTDDCTAWFSRAFWAEHGVGVAELRPGTDPDPTLAEWVATQLDLHATA